MPTNTASWLIGAKVSPLQVKPAPYTAPRENKIVIKNGAVAINPMDWMLQDQGTSMMFTWLKYALVLGADVAGEVVEIGSRVTRFNIDDRVVGQWSCGWYGSEAQQVFDYNSKTVVIDLIHAFEGKTTAGALSIGPGAAEARMDILDKCKGNKFISMASYPMPQQPPKRFALLTTIYCFVSWSVSNWIKSKARGIRYKFIFGSTLIVGKAVYADYLPEALITSTYIAAPEPVVVGKGLEHIQAGLDPQKKGMSAKKVVVSL